MASGSKTTSTTITFVTQALKNAAGGVDGNISIQLDDVKNNDKNQFSSGDTVYFKVFTSPLNMTLSPDATAGTVTIGAEETSSVTETVTFVNEKEATLDFIASSLTSYRWFGWSLGAPSINGNVVTVPNSGIGVMEITYSARGRAGTLSGVTIPAGVDEFPVVVVIAEQAAA